MPVFEGVASTQPTVAGLRITSRAQATSASCLTLVPSSKPRAETTFKIVSKLGLPRSSLTLGSQLHSFLNHKARHYECLLQNTPPHLNPAVYGMF